MSKAVLFEQLRVARTLAEARLASLQRGDRVQGNEEELRMFLDDFASTESDALRETLPRDERSMASARRVLDSWPYEDELVCAIMDAANTYRNI